MAGPDEAAPPARRRIPVGRILVVLAVIVLAALLARRLDMDRLLAAFRRADFRLWALAGLSNLTINTAARVGRWRALLRPLPRDDAGTTFAELSGVYFASQAATNLLPARAGEALRVVELHRRHGYPVPGLITVQLVETLVGAVTLGLFTLPMVPLGQAPAELKGPVLIFALAGPAGMVALFLLARFVPPVAMGNPVGVPQTPPVAMRNPVGVPQTPPVGSVGTTRIARIVSGARGLLHRLLDAVRLLGSSRVWAESLAWSLLSDVTDVMMIALVLAAVGVSLPPTSWVMIYAAINLVLLAPTTPAQLGVLEVGAVGALVAFGVDENAALAFALLYHAAHVLPPTVVGAILLLRFDVRGRAGAQGGSGAGTPP